VIMEVENEEVGHGLNIPGKVVDGDHRCEEMLRMNAFVGCVQLAIRLNWIVSCL